MTLVISSLFWCSVVYFLAKLFLRQAREFRPIFLVGLIVKIAAGICVGLIYTYYYTAGDTFGFFKDGQTLAALFHKARGEYFNFLLWGDGSSEMVDALVNVQRRSLFLVKNLSVVSMVSFNNYWMSSIVFSIVSFLGCWYALNKFTIHFPEGKWAAIISLLFIPSFVFWSAGITKESLSIAALMFLTGFTIVIVSHGKSKSWEWIIAIVAVLYLWNLKYYWAALFIPAAIVTILLIKVVIPYTQIRNKTLEIILWIILFCFIILGVSNIHPNFYLSRFLNVVVDNYNAYAIASENGPVVHFVNLQANWISILLNSPWALFSGLFRPFIFEVFSVFQAAIAIENLVLLTLCLYNVKHISNAWNSSNRLLVISALVYIGLLAVFLTLSTPNFGTLSRYRIGFLPLLFFLLLYYPSQVIFNKDRK
ncbi:MAG: hypothetical protein KF860_07000 [Cyclobacteriaceae bacterium]|nr:hypothetical protein [Cyclobacteriaceae bacterium]